MRFPSSPGQEHSFPHVPFAFRTAAAGILVASAVAVVALLFPAPTLPGIVPQAGAILVLGAVFWFHAQFLRWSREQVLRTRLSLDDRDRELLSLFHGAFDAILIFDDQLICQEGNPAAAQLLGLDQRLLAGRSVNEFAHDPATVARLRKEMLVDNPHHGRLELTRADGSQVSAEFSFRAGGVKGQHLLRLRDATALARAKETNGRVLAAARSGVVEAHLLRRATVALSRMDPLNVLLDNLLDILHTAIPCEIGQIFILENHGRVFLARQRSWGARGEKQPGQLSSTFDLAAFPLLTQLLEERRGMLIGDTRAANNRCGSAWEFSSGSWLGVPLYAGEGALGFLMLAHSDVGHLTTAHLRLAGALAGPLALAICKSRLFERGEIFRTELTCRMSDFPPV